MGPSVNLAARLMCACSKHGVDLLVGEEFRKANQPRIKAALHNPVAKTLPRPCLGSQN